MDRKISLYILAEACSLGSSTVTAPTKGLDMPLVAKHRLKGAQSKITRKKEGVVFFAAVGSVGLILGIGIALVELAKLLLRPFRYLWHIIARKQPPPTMKEAASTHQNEE